MRGGGTGTFLVTIAATAALLAGALLVVADLQHLAPSFMDPATKFSEQVQSPYWLLHGTTHILATLSLLLALPGLFLAHEERFGRFGRGAFLASFVFVAAYLGVAFVMTLGAPQIPAETIDQDATGAMAVAFLAYPLSALALFGLGIAMIRAGLVDRWAAITFSLGSLLMPVTDVLASVVNLRLTGAIVFGIGVFGVGRSVLRSQTVTPAKETGPRPVRG